MSLTIRYFAAAKAAVGVGQERIDDVPPGLTIQRFLEARAATAADPEAARAVLARCSFIVNTHATPDHRAALTSGDTLDVLPPFAGG